MLLVLLSRVCLLGGVLEYFTDDRGRSIELGVRINQVASSDVSQARRLQPPTIEAAGGLCERGMIDA